MPGFLEMHSFWVCSHVFGKYSAHTRPNCFKDNELGFFLAGTGLILRCDVFVDSIHRIEIATTTRELLLGESPEVFDVYGYDKEGIKVIIS